jgi:gamma-glutamyltranspeptidase / glutathione hydrolase
MSALEALGGPHGGAFRPPAVGTRGVTAAAHGLAAFAGQRMLLAGGNAVDAAVAVAAALGVVEPFMSGLGGGGGLMLIYEAKSGAVHALDYMGRVPVAADPGAFGDLEAISADVRSSTVPSLPAGWLAAHARFGSLDRATLFEPAIELAELGWPVTPFAAQMFAEQQTRLAHHATSAALYLPAGRPPRAGERLRQPDLARSYRQLVDGGADALYRGDLGRRLVAAVQAAGGWLTESDLAAVQPTWLEPISVDYRGHRVHSLPLPSSGFQYLECLRILEPVDLPALGHNSADYLHLLLETIKLASADRTRHAGADAATIAGLLDPAYAAERRARIDRRRAAPSEGERYLADKTDQIQPGDPRRPREHTTHFETADADGNLVAATQSNGAAFGCGFVAGDTGILLNNFLYWTDLDPASPIYMRPGSAQREIPMAPCIVTRPDGQPTFGIGTPGSYGILQTTLQMLLNRLDFGLNVQASIEAPRVRAYERTIVEVESRIPEATRVALVELGHEVRPLEQWSWRVGGGHGIARDPDTGVLSGGADPRRDGQALAW